MAQMPTYKFILLGDLDVGKTSFLLRLKYGRFVENITDECTGSDCLEYTQVVDGTTVKVRSIIKIGGRGWGGGGGGGGGME